MNCPIRSMTRAFAATLMIALTVGSCGGGSGDSFAGIDRLGVSTGAITGFGSIFVNGVEWRTNSASISIDGTPGSESQLRVGHVVTVRGKLDTDGLGGAAESVEFDAEVEGPIAAIDTNTASFIVLNQNVIVSSDTTFDDDIPAGSDGQRDLADLSVGNVVEVSGYRDATGAVRATRIELRVSGTEDEINGVVTNLDTGATTFQIGGLIVNYAGATLQDFGSDTLSNDDLVEVKGSFAGGVLSATRIEREAGSTGEPDEKGEVEGFITRFASVADFDVAGVRVITDSETEFEGGAEADLALNVKVEVEGHFNTSGLLVADKVEIRIQPEDTDVKIAGNVASINSVAGTITLQGAEVLIIVSSATSFEDESSPELRDFSIADLGIGDYVAIRGAVAANTLPVNDMIATRVERKNADDEFLLRGPVQAVNPPDLSILGVQVVTDFAQFRDSDDAAIDEATFFATIAPGDVVTARTTTDQVNGNILVAGEVEIEELE